MGNPNAGKIQKDAEKVNQPQQDPQLQQHSQNSFYPDLTTSHNISNLQQVSGAEGQYWKNLPTNKKNAMDNQFQHVLNNKNRLSGQSNLPQEPPQQFSAAQITATPISSFSSYMQAKAKHEAEMANNQANIGASNSAYKPATFTLVKGQQIMAPQQYDDQKALIQYHQHQSHLHQSNTVLKKQNAGHQLSVGQIRQQTNNNVNNWFIQRLKTILQGGPTSIQASLGHPPQQAMQTQQYQPQAPVQKNKLATKDGNFMELSKWQQEQNEIQANRVSVKGLLPVPQGEVTILHTNAPSSLTQTLASQHIQQQLHDQKNSRQNVKYEQRTINSNNPKQTSGEAQSIDTISHDLGKQRGQSHILNSTNNSQLKMAKDGVNNVQQTASFVHMPEVVTKMTQNSLSFQAIDNNKRTQNNTPQISNNGQAGVSSQQSNVLVVPALPKTVLYNSREGGLALELQHSDLGSSYKSGVVNGPGGGTDPAVTTSKTAAGSSLSNQMQANQDAGRNMEQQLRVNTYIRQREMSNFLRREELQQMTGSQDLARATTNSLGTQNESEYNMHMGLGFVGTAGSRRTNNDGISLLQNKKYKKTRNIVANSDMCPKSVQNNIISVHEVGSGNVINAERDIQRKMTAKSNNNREDVQQSQNQLTYQTKNRGVKFSHTDNLAQRYTADPSGSNIASNQIGSRHHSNVRMNIRKQSQNHPPPPPPAKQASAYANGGNASAKSTATDAANGILFFLKNGTTSTHQNKISSQAIRQERVNMLMNERNNTNGVDNLGSQVIQTGAISNAPTSGGVLTKQSLQQRVSDMSNNSKRPPVANPNNPLVQPSSSNSFSAGLKQQHQQYIMNMTNAGQAFRQGDIAMGKTAGPRSHAKAQQMLHDNSSGAASAATQMIGNNNNMGPFHEQASRSNNQHHQSSGRYIGMNSTTVNSNGSARNGIPKGLGSHRHSLEKLKEYESQLLMSQSVANHAQNSNFNQTAQSAQPRNGKNQLNNAAHSNSGLRQVALQQKNAYQMQPQQKPYTKGIATPSPYPNQNFTPEHTVQFPVSKVIGKKQYQAADSRSLN